MPPVQDDFEAAAAIPYIQHLPRKERAQVQLRQWADRRPGSPAEGAAGLGRRADRRGLPRPTDAFRAIDQLLQCIRRSVLTRGTQGTGQLGRSAVRTPGQRCANDKPTELSRRRARRFGLLAVRTGIPNVEPPPVLAQDSREDSPAFGECLLLHNVQPKDVGREGLRAPQAAAHSRLHPPEVQEWHEEPRPR